MRFAFPAAVAVVVVACSGAGTPSLYGPHEGDAGGSSGSGSSGSSSGVSSSGGFDAMPMGDDENDATIPPEDAALDVHEAAVPACMPSPPDGGAALARVSVRARSTLSRPNGIAVAVSL